MTEKTYGGKTLEELKALDAAAFGGQWLAMDHAIITSDGRIALHVFAQSTCGRSYDDFYGCRDHRAAAELKVKPENMALIVAYRSSTPALVSEVEKKDAQIRAAIRRGHHGLPAYTESELALHCTIREMQELLRVALSPEERG